MCFPPVLFYPESVIRHWIALCQEDSFPVDSAICMNVADSPDFLFQRSPVNFQTGIVQSDK